MARILWVFNIQFPQRTLRIIPLVQNCLNVETYGLVFHLLGNNQLFSACKIQVNIHCVEEWVWSGSVKTWKLFLLQKKMGKKKKRGHPETTASKKKKKKKSCPDNMFCLAWSQWTKEQERLWRHFNERKVHSHPCCLLMVENCVTVSQCQWLF